MPVVPGSSRSRPTTAATACWASPVASTASAPSAERRHLAGRARRSRSAAALQGDADVAGDHGHGRGRRGPHREPAGHVVHEHVPDGVRGRRSARGRVRDLQRLLHHGRATHQGDGDAAGHRLQPQAGAAHDRRRVGGHGRGRLGDRCGARHRPGQGPGGAVHVVRPGAARRRDRRRTRFDRHRHAGRHRRDRAGRLPAGAAGVEGGPDGRHARRRGRLVGCLAPACGDRHRAHRARGRTGRRRSEW